MKHIYIVLSQTGTIFSKAIRLYTNDPYNHASISFDSSLSVMYSFGRRGRYNMLNSGFVEENFGRGLFTFFPNAHCCIIEVPVSDEEYDKMFMLVKLFCLNPLGYRYNFLGVLAYIIHFNLNRDSHYFCSQFVSYILSQTSFWNSDPHFTRPMDFMDIPHKRIVFEGRICDYIHTHWHQPAFGI